MPLVKDESTVKPKSQFLKYEGGEMGNQLALISHLYQIDSHFLNSVSRSVICKAGAEEGVNECLYCSANYPVNREFNYRVFLNGQVGIMDIKGSVFFAIQRIAKAQKKDMRQIVWTVIGEGEGKKRRYTTSKDDNLSDDEWKNLQEELDENTNKLIAAMDKHEEDLNQNYVEFIDKIKKQSPQREQSEDGEEVDPGDIPF